MKFGSPKKNKTEDPRNVKIKNERKKLCVPYFQQTIVIFTA